jgi:hypothetical protein
MSTVLIDAGIGIVAAVTFASLASSFRAFLPTWRRLSADMTALQGEQAVRISVRDTTPKAETCTPLPASNLISWPRDAARSFRLQAVDRPALPAAA